MADLDGPGATPGGDSGSAEAQIRTFLIADVRGYTLFTQERGDEAAAKLAAKFADIAREVVEGRGGTLLELRGDEALCVFASAREAIRAALDLQQRFVEETLEQPELPLTVGIGLDAGEAVQVQGGYRGGALNLAARLCGQARAGEILASREVTHLARRIDGARYEDRGSLTLKGIDHPVAVVRVAPEVDDPAERLKPFAPAPPAEPKRSRRWILVGAGIALVIALVAISIPLLGSDDGGSSVEIGSNSVARLDASDGSVAFATSLGQRPGAAAVGHGSLWVAQPDRGVVARLNLEDGSVTDTIRVGTAPTGIAVGDGAVWVSNAADGTVSRINVETNEVSQTLPAGSVPSGIAYGDGALWVADSVGAALLRLDPATGDVQSVALSGQPSGVAFTPDGVWVSVSPNTVARIDPTDPSVTLTQDVGNGPSAIVPAFGSIWVANHLDGTVSRLDPSTGRVQATVEAREGPNALASTADTMWVGNEFDDSISSIDPATNVVSATRPVGGSAASLTADGDDLWLAVGASASEHRGGTLIASTDFVPDTIDPAVVYASLGWYILAITNDGLVSYKKVGGPDGATLVPDLATALPEVSPDGLTYRFPLREGIRYSTGEPVLPEDFRHGLERAIALSGDAANLFGSLEGAQACQEDPATCDLSSSIVVDDGAVTYHLARPDPDLPLKLALPFAFPVPASVPLEDQGLNPVPATGPYMVAEAGPDGLELVRNPEFEEWSGAAQPDGFVDAISLVFGLQPPGAFEQLVAGEVDLMLDPPMPEDLETLRATHPDQVVASPQPFTLMVGIDALQPPFDDERVRQALSLALDREHVVDLLGGPTTNRVTCQILPPNFQGYAPFCPHTLEPESNVWSAPDLASAQALVEEAGAVGDPVRVSVTDAPGYLAEGSVEVMRHVTDVLNELGLRAKLEIVPDGQAYFDVQYEEPAGTPEHPQVFMTGWISDYLGAANFIDLLFRCGSPTNVWGWCDPAMDAQMDEALALYATDPGASNRTWTDIEHQLVDQAAVAPLTNPVTTYAVSARTENVQVHPQWGVLLSRVWIQ